MVVDDEPVVRSAAKSTLERFGYEVLLANNGREGVRMFRQHRRKIAMVLLDMTMPVMSGEEALQGTDGHFHRQTPVVGSSGL